MKFWGFGLFLAVLALALPQVGLAAEVAPTKIEILGNRRIEVDAILEKMKIKPGTVLSSEKVREDILSIFSLGFFENVSFEINDTSLQVKVVERPVITNILFEGSEEFEKKDLDELIGIKAFTVLNPGKIRSAQIAISKRYEEKGYYLARADYELKPVKDRQGEIELIFKIQENERVQVRRVHFLGNKHFTSGDLKQIMMTSESHAFSWATSGGTYRQEAFERDLAVLAFYYGNDGYIQAKFAKPRVTLSQDRRYVDILVDVDEGPQFFLGKISFKGDLLFSEEELRRSFEMKDADVFSTGKLQEEVLKLTDKYGDEGYAFANVIPHTQIREGSTIVDLDFDVEKGEKVYWGKISVTGNSKTHDKVVRRELPFFEGELYNATKRKKGMEKIRRLGFFGNDIAFLTTTPKGSSSVLDLEIRVSERPTGSLNVQAGYGTGSGFSTGAQISQNNLMGLGQQLSFNMNLSFATGGTKTFNLQFTDPKAFDTEWLMGGDLYIQESTVGGLIKTFDQRISGAVFRVGREISESVSLLGSYKLEHSLIKNPITMNIFDPGEKLENYVSSVTGTLAYDTRNNRIDPTGGAYASASTEFAGLGGLVFQKYLFAGRLYRKLFWKFVYRANVEIGALTNSFTDSPVPTSERFVLGGVFSLRGYPGGEVGPGKRVIDERDLKPDGSPLHPAPFDYVRGGKHKFVTNQEIEFPLIPEADIRAALFFDAGNSWDRLSDRSPAILSNYGFGFRWYTPLGPLRFEWGFPLSTLPSKGNRNSEFVFIIAPTF